MSKKYKNWRDTGSPASLKMNIESKRLQEITLRDFYSSFKNISEKTRKLFEIFIEASKFANRYEKLLLANAGFAVDLAAGRITRNHDDLDIVVLEKDIDWFRDYFRRKNFEIGCAEGKNPNYSFTIQKEDLYGDIDSIRIRGEEVSDKGDLGEKRWIWPGKTSELVWARKIDSVLAKFLSPVIIYDFKKRQQKRDIKREKEAHDFKILEKVLGKYF